MIRPAIVGVVAMLAALGLPAPATAQHDHSQHTQPPAKTPVPPVTDADRKAAFPAGMEGHAVHDRKFNFYSLFDQLEWQGSDDGGLKLENTSWFGGDINRLWLRLDGESDDGTLESATGDLLFGHSFSRWWDVVVGLRQDVRPGDPQTWAAVGVQGLAPQWFEVEFTGYVGGGGRTAARLELEYELLLTNRLILQPLIELDMYGKDDPERGIAAGLSSMESGLRLRYEIRRELAPYVGVTWDQKLFGTADIVRAAGEETGKTRVAFGLRAWF